MKKQEDGSFKNVFYTTEAGHILRKLIEDGLGLDKSGYYIDYAYNLVPRVLSRDKFNRAVKYKPPTQTEANAEYKYLYERIIREKPDIIVPTGNIGCKALIGKSAISKLRGVPEKVTVKAEIGGNMDQLEVAERHQRLVQQLEAAEAELDSFVNLYIDRLDESNISNEYEMLQNNVQNLHEQIENNGQPSQVQTHDVWVLPMYSMEYMLVNPNIQNLIEADFVTLKKFVDEGEAAFEASPVDYEFVTDIERVREIFTKEIPNAPLTAWDLETNTLKPELSGAKPLVISLSWKEGEGATIPLEHKDFTWLPGHLNEIYELIKQFVADPNIVKVAHNGQYDIRFLRLTKGFDKFENIRDTKVMYYLLVNQDVEGSLMLSDLAYELTDMGGYDKALDDYKRDYIESYIASEKERIANLKKENKLKLSQTREQVKGLKRLVKQAEEELKTFERTYTMSEIEEDSYLVERRIELYDNIDNYEKQLESSERLVEELRTKKFPKAEAPKNEVDGSDFNYEWIPLKKMLHPYASGDVDACLRIHNQLDEIGKKKENVSLRKLYTEHYTDLTNYLAKIEANGVPMDIPYNESLTEAYIEEEERIVEEMRKFPEVQELESQHRTLYEKGLAEWAIPKAQRDEEVAKLRDKYKKKLKFNPNSSDDKKRVLYDIMGIRLPYNKEYLVDSAVEDGIPEDEIEWYHYKTNKTSLEYIKDNFEEAAELAEMLLTHSLVKTRRQGFTYKLRNMVDPNGHLHGGFNPTGTACVSGDTLLITGEGIKQIQDLSDNRKEGTFSDIDVDVHSYEKVEKADGFYYNGTREGIKITLAEGTTITTSKNHPLLSNYKLPKVKMFKREIRRHPEIVDMNTWTPAEEIKEGNYIALKVGTELYGNKEYIEYDRTFYRPSKFSKTKNIRIPEYMTEGLAEWLGIYTADGSYSVNSNGTVNITITNSNLEVLNRFIELTKRVFDHEAEIAVNKKRSESVRISSRHLASWLLDVMGIASKAENKNIPKPILEGTKKVQQAFIRGYSLDSGIGRNKFPSVTFSTVSGKLARALRVILYNMGIVTRLYKAKPYKDNELPVYQVTVVSGFVEKYLDEIGFIETDKLQRLKNLIEPYHYEGQPRIHNVVLTDKYVFVKVTDVEVVEEVELFDLHVPESHSFVGNGVVNHNTSRLSSQHPNLQQLPRSTGDVTRFDYKYPIKRMFVTNFEGGALLQLDYSSLESRVLALAAKDEEMTQAFLDGADIHKETASLVFGVPVDEVTGDQRSAAKSTTFGKKHCRLVS